MAKIKLNGEYYYQVEEGDNYFKIGKKLYGQISAAPLIAQVNPDFEFLKTGAVIDLPEDIPEEIIIPYKKKERETFVEAVSADIDDPNPSLSDAQGVMHEVGSEIQVDLLLTLDEMQTDGLLGRSKRL